MSTTLTRPPLATDLEIVDAATRRQFIAM